MKCCSLSITGFFLSALHLAAATTAAAGVVKETNFLEILWKGGIMMVPLAIMSVITTLLILVFLLTVRRNAVVSDSFMNTLEALLRKRDFLGLINHSHSRNECMARITSKTMDFINANPGVPFEDVKEVAQAEGSHQAGMLTSRITYLADIGAIAPMVGLLGTVIGMIEAFIEISSGEVAGVRQMGLAEGVSKALIATAGGLAISIPALAFYSIMRGRVQKYTFELEAAATHFIALLHAQFERPAAPLYAPPSLSPLQQAQRQREDYAMPVATPLSTERPDLHGI